MNKNTIKPEITVEAKVLYRCFWEDKCDCAETFSQQEIEIGFTEYPVIKETDKTYTVNIGKYHNSKYGTKSNAVVLKDQSGKRFAYATKERALEAFIIKRRSYGGRLKQSIKNNDRLIGIANQLGEKLSEKGGSDA